MNIGGLIFGAFCMFVVVAGVMYVAAMNGQSAPITDSYGNTLGNTTNGSQAVALPDGIAPGFGIMLLIVGVILVVAVIFGIWLAAKTFLT